MCENHRQGGGKECCDGSLISVCHSSEQLLQEKKGLFQEITWAVPLPCWAPSPAGAVQRGRPGLTGDASEQNPAGQGEIAYLNLVERLRHGGGGLEAEQNWCLVSTRGFPCSK